MDGRETLPSSTKGRLTFGCHPCQCRWHVSLQCRTAAAASSLPSVVRLHRIGSNEEAAVTLKRTIWGSLSVRPAARGRHQGRAGEGLKLPVLMSYLVVPRAGYCRHPGARGQPLHILFPCLGMVLSTSKRDDGGAHQRGKLAVFSRCNAICIVCAPFRVGTIP